MALSQVTGKATGKVTGQETTDPAPPPADEEAPLDVGRIREDFPILSEPSHGRRLVYLDSAASSQKPTAVVAAMDAYYAHSHANVHRGVYELAERATALYEAARGTVAGFVGAPPEELVFTKSVTESLNLVASAWGRAHLHAGDAVLLTEMEHHANLVPWLMLAEERGLELRYLPFDDQGELDLSDLERLSDGVKVVSFTLCSNVLGTIVDPVPLVAAGRAAGALVVADGAQFVPHAPVDVRRLGVDLLGFTGHKMLGPTGIGALWGRREILEAMPPYQGGGEMILDVRLDGFTPTEPPWRFEAGTPPIAEAIGLAEAVRYLERIGVARIAAHEHRLVSQAMEQLEAALGPSIVIHGPRDPARRGGILSFELVGVHAHDVAQILDEQSVCVRAGHHCAKPLLRRLGITASPRASFYLYNDLDDVDALVAALTKARDLFGS
jgi:cysteine desulfurase/selenocysteine lyase